MEAVFEQFHLLKYYAGWSLFEFFNLPVGLRGWFVRRLKRQLEEEADARNKAQQKNK